MKTGFLYHPDCLAHEPGPAHPEQPARARAVRGHFESSGLLAELELVEPGEADPAALARVHTATYLAHVEEVAARAPAYLDSGDTPVSTGSLRAARLAAGAALTAVDHVARGEWRRAFCCARPPGHHAERDFGMGFCFYNNAAVAAEELRHRHGLERVAIVDWDVHHGNGTQHAFEADAGIFYASLHEFPLYPGTGAAHERGRGAGEGTTLNCPQPGGATDRDWLAAFEHTVLPALEDFAPEFVIISAGFDAHADDPLASTRLSEEAYRSMTQGLVELAERHAAGRVVSLLEGGYNLDALARSAAAHVEALCT